MRLFTHDSTLVTSLAFRKNLREQLEAFEKEHNIKR